MYDRSGFCCRLFTSLQRRYLNRMLSQSPRYRSGFCCRLFTSLQRRYLNRMLSQSPKDRSGFCCRLFTSLQRRYLNRMLSQSPRYRSSFCCRLITSLQWRYLNRMLSQSPRTRMFVEHIALFYNSENIRESICGWWISFTACQLYASNPMAWRIDHSRLSTVYPKKYAHGFVVLCFVVVMQSFIMNSHEVFIHIHQGCFAGTEAIVRLPQCQWSKPDGYGKISQCITTTKHSKAKTVCIFLGIYCSIHHYLPHMLFFVWFIAWYGRPQTFSPCTIFNCHCKEVRLFVSNDRKPIKFLYYAIILRNLRPHDPVTTEVLT